MVGNLACKFSSSILAQTAPHMPHLAIPGADVGERRGIFRRNLPQEMCT